MIAERMTEMILGYDRNDWEQFQIKNPVEIVLPKKTSNILIAGIWFREIFVSTVVSVATAPQSRKPCVHSRL